LDARFPVCVFRKLRGETLGLEDLGELFPMVANSFRTLLKWQPSEDLEKGAANELFANTFCLDFTVSFQDEGQSRTKELKPGGKDLAVTLENRAEFVTLYCDWALTEGVAKQFEPFKRGFSRVCESPLLQAFTGDELSRIVMGETDIELDNLRPKAKYEGYTAASECMFWFWSVLQDFDSSHRRLFLSFVTGSDRSPVGGLGELQLIIQKKPGALQKGNKGRRLPTAHTCFNTLILPEYGSLIQLREALVSAIENTEGFGLE